MPTLVPLLVAALISAAPAPPAWVEDAATQLLAKAMVEEARLRTGVKTGEVTPTHADLVRALTRCLENTDNLLLLSGLRRVPSPVAEAPVERPRRRRIILLSDVERGLDTDHF